MGNDLIVLDRKARRELEQLVIDGNTAQKIAKRARIVLMTADGHGVVAIMREVWQDYFAEAGVDGVIKGRSKPPGQKPLSAAIKLNLVERLFAEITRQRIRQGTFNDVTELKTAITEWIEHRNQHPKPFKWTASAKSILAKHRRAKKRSQSQKRDANE